MTEFPCIHVAIFQWTNVFTTYHILLLLIHLKKPHVYNDGSKNAGSNVVSFQTKMELNQELITENWLENPQVYDVNNRWVTWSYTWVKKKSQKNFKNTLD